MVIQWLRNIIRLSSYPYIYYIIIWYNCVEKRRYKELMNVLQNSTTYRLNIYIIYISLGVCNDRECFLFYFVEKKEAKLNVIWYCIVYIWKGRWLLLMGHEWKLSIGSRIINVMYLSYFHSNRLYGNASENANQIFMPIKICMIRMSTKCVWRTTYSNIHRTRSM